MYNVQFFECPLNKICEHLHKTSTYIVCTWRMFELPAKIPHLTVVPSSLVVLLSDEIREEQQKISKQYTSCRQKML